MKKKQAKAKKYQAALVITLGVFAAAGLGHWFGAFAYLEYKTYDLRVTLTSESLKPADDIVVVLLDQNSLDWADQERGWGFPWPRKAYGEFLDYMRASGAAAVVFDVLFSEPSLYGPDDDRAFASSAAAFGRSVQDVILSTQTGRDLSWPQNLKKPLFKTAGFDSILHKYSAPFGEQYAAQFPVGPIRDAAGSVSCATGIADPDSIFRRANLFTMFDGKAVPGLAVGALLVNGETEQITYNEKKQRIQWGPYAIPVDRDGRTLLRFRGNLDRYIPYSISAVLQSAEAYRNGGEPLLVPEDFAGKYVFFGYYAHGLFDIFHTPISSTYPGVGVHITFLDNLLQQDFNRESPVWLGFALIFAAVSLMTFLVLYAGKVWMSVGGCGILLAGLCALGLGAYVWGGQWVPVVAPGMGLFIAFLSATLYNYATEGRQKLFIKSAFSQYLSPSVIDQLLANPERLSLGGERREISIFFSDVQGFTTISEKLDPSQLTELLNDYLSVMTDTIIESGGTIDKYEGDAIIAFWNAPLTFEDHAARALRASLACQALMVERQEFFKQKFGASLLTRIGLNTGFAVVGNMGSSIRFDYTMIGDSVNLAARLEGLNKQFGTYLMCTEATFTQAVKAASFFGRKLALVAVVGKKEPVAVWEPMAEEAFQAKKAVLERFDTARDLFYQGNFAEALPLFTALAEQDKPSFYYIEQCAYYLEHPHEWKGFWQAKTK
ncbi:MAG: adenylate/guanylate cyclase domain-containing protein [Spirochaetaceae bacterium]|jgi:class 3 adenylate cyclase/CHASE2 domain-containing sensor protein|nr:adenylate/guanylate cyclase domain-containing protein [Spirochaetaceae bacterium]